MSKRVPAVAVKVKSEDVYVGSAVNLRKSDWRLLRRVAEMRVDRAGGGRPSVSKVIERLIDENRKSLKTELA
jgi:hypothetical protein